MERLAGEHRIDLGVRERDVLGAAVTRVRGRHPPREHRAQLGERLDGDHARVAPRERLGQLAGARTEIEHGRGRVHGHEVEHVIRPAGTPAVVLGRGALEASRRLGQPTPASRNARFSFSISRAMTRRWIWFVPS